MDFPCPSCGTSTQFADPSSQDPTGVVVCRGCGNRIRVAVQHSEPSIDQEEYRRAQVFARENQIDLPTAYSVLEGLFTLEEAVGGIEPINRSDGSVARSAGNVARSAGNVARSAESGAGRAGGVAGRYGNGAGQAGAVAGHAGSGSSVVPAKEGRARFTPLAPSSPADLLQYDPGFAEAIRDGCLTVQQAVERGDRQALASRLADRHLLPLDLALLAADHRITIRQAVQQRAARVEQEQSAALSAGRSGVLKLVAVLVGTAALFTFAAVLVQGMRGGGQSTGSEGVSAGTGTGTEAGTTRSESALLHLLPNESDRVQAGPTTSKSDSEGRLLKVVGPDPKSVLVGFCTSGRRADLKDPVGIAELSPPVASLRLGIFRNNALSSLPARAIKIRKDVQTGEWIAGDGVTPISSESVLAPASGTEAKPQAPSAGTEPPAGARPDEG